MGSERKICLPPYKMVYAILFLLLLALVRGIWDISEIGIVLDTYAAFLAIVFCADTYEMEYLGKRWEIFSLVPDCSKQKVVTRRLTIQTGFLCLLSYAGYFAFYWQKPGNMFGVSPVLLYLETAAAVTITIVFWSLLSLTMVCLCRNIWVGIGSTCVFWLFLISRAGMDLLGRYNIFAFTFREVEARADWIWGKGLAVLAVLVMAAAIPRTLRKRGF